MCTNPDEALEAQGHRHCTRQYSVRLKSPTATLGSRLILAKFYCRKAFFWQSLILAKLYFGKALLWQSLILAKPYFGKALLSQSFLLAKPSFGKALLWQSLLLAKRYQCESRQLLGFGYIVMAYIVMAYVGMAYIPAASQVRLYSHSRI